MVLWNLLWKSWDNFFSGECSEGNSSKFSICSTLNFRINDWSIRKISFVIFLSMHSYSLLVFWSLYVRVLTECLLHVCIFICICCCGRSLVCLRLVGVCVCISLCTLLIDRRADKLGCMCLCLNDTPLAQRDGGSGALHFLRRGGVLSAGVFELAHARAAASPPPPPRGREGPSSQPPLMYNSC